MKLRNIVLALILTLCTTLAFSQELSSTDTTLAQIEKQDMDLRHFIGSSLFLLGNIDSGDPVYYGQLNYGYKLTPKEKILVEAATWTYYEPLGTYGNSEETYPGKVSAYGIGLGYQRFLWKNTFTSVVATPFLQQFYDEDDKEIQKGFQLYLQFLLGYRWEFLNKRWFIEPAIALTYWPINTNIPDSFSEINKGTPGYKFEPRANFGFSF